MKFLIVNGPNLNLLGSRSPEIYGKGSMEDTLQDLRARFSDHQIDYFQSNHEGDLIDRIHQCMVEDYQGLVINPGALSHYSLALHDALEALEIKKVEVHISQIYRREEFRRKTVTGPACDALISGMGRSGYTQAVEWLIEQGREPVG